MNKNTFKKVTIIFSIALITCGHCSAHYGTEIAIFFQLLSLMVVGGFISLWVAYLLVKNITLQRLVFSISMGLSSSILIFNFWSYLLVRLALQSYSQSMNAVGFLFFFKFPIECLVDPKKAIFTVYTPPFSWWHLCSISLIVITILLPNIKRKKIHNKDERFQGLRLSKRYLFIILACVAITMYFNIQATIEIWPKIRKVQQYQTFIAAAKNGNTEQLSRMLEAYPEVLNYPAVKLNAAKAASKFGSQQTIDYLFRKHVKPTLLTAVEIGRKDVINSIFTDKNIGYTNKDLYLALDWCYRHKEMESLRYLASFIAPYKNHHSDKLESYKSLIDNPKEFINSVLYHAVKQDDIETVKLLAPRLNLNLYNSFQETVLHQVVKSGNTKILSYLLTLNPDVNILTGIGAPLHVAAQYADKKTIKLLLDAGADINCVDKSGITPLNRSIMRREITNADYLLDKGAAINDNSLQMSKQIITLKGDKFASRIAKMYFEQSNEK